MARARLALAALALPALIACEREPSFEERYDQRAKELEARLRTLDARIAKDMAAARLGAAVEGGASEPVPRAAPAQASDKPQRPAAARPDAPPTR